MGYIRVIYKEKGFDYIPASLLGELIGLDQITHFYRPSEKRWISIKFDAVRGSGGWYTGPERRTEQSKTESMQQKAGASRAPDWMESLWRHIGSLEH